MCRAAVAPDSPKVLPENLRILIYPNVGSCQGETEVLLEQGSDFARVLGVVSKSVLGCGVETPLFTPRLFNVLASSVASGNNGQVQCSDTAASECENAFAVREIVSVADLLHRPSRTSVVASDGSPFRPWLTSKCCSSIPQALADAARLGKRRFEDGLVGGQILRIDASDPELPSLLRCSVPVIIANSGLLGNAPDLWNFEYFERHLSDVDNFFVLRSPAQNNGRFAYYDMGEQKNPCGYPVSRTNERVEMRFPEFRKMSSQFRRDRNAGRDSPSMYLQSALLHREVTDQGPPRAVGAFGTRCGVQVAKDIGSFKWSWLRRNMGGRHVQTCQLFCGFSGGFSPCHYDPQDNIFGQVRGYKRVLLFHPRHFANLYPWPVHHPQDRQSRVDFDAPDAGVFQRYPFLRNQGLEALLGPGDLLRIPPSWWHHVEMLPSPLDEVTSINFWYPAPSWFYGDVRAGDASIDWDRPLFGAKRLLFQRCIEDLIAQIAGPAKVATILRVALGFVPVSAHGQNSADVNQAISALGNFTENVFPDENERRAMLREVLDARFVGLLATDSSSS